MLRLTVLPKRTSNPFISKLLSITSIYAPQCLLLQPPRDLLMCPRRCPFLRNFFLVYSPTDTIYHLPPLSVYFSALFMASSGLIYIFLIVSSYIYCLLCFSSSLSSYIPSLCFHRYVLTLLNCRFPHSVGSKFMPFLPAFCCFIYTVRSVGVLCATHTCKGPTNHPSTSIYSSSPLLASMLPFRFDTPPLFLPAEL